MWLLYFISNHVTFYLFHVLNVVCLLSKGVQFYSHTELENTTAIRHNNNHEMCNCLLAVLWMLDGSFPTGDRKTIHHDIETVCMAYECQMWKVIQWVTSHNVCCVSLNGFMPHRGIYVGSQNRRGVC